MAVKQLFVPFDTFIVQVGAIEIGVISDLATQYLRGLGDQKHPYTGELYRDMYFLPYPFQRSFSAHCIDYCATQKDVEEYYKKWGREHAKDMTEDTVLPIRYDKNHTWRSFYAGRLTTILDNGITAEDYNRNGDMAVLVDSDRTNYAYIDIDAEKELKALSIMVLRAGRPESFIQKVADGLGGSDHVIFDPPFDPTHNGTSGKVMVGGPFVKYGPTARRWLMQVSEELAEHFGGITGYEFDKLELIMADFGDYDECPYRSKCPYEGECSISDCVGYVDPNWTDDERIAAQAHPFERGAVRGEKLHKNTTTYVSPWFEY